VEAQEKSPPLAPRLAFVTKVDKAGGTITVTESIATPVFRAKRGLPVLDPMTGFYKNACLVYEPVGVEYVTTTHEFYLKPVKFLNTAIGKDYDGQSKVMTVAGKKLAPDAAWPQLKVGDPVLIASDDRAVDAQFLRSFKESMLIFHPPIAPLPADERDDGNEGLPIGR
jgi:hypothetical protein